MRACHLSAAMQACRACFNPTAPARTSAAKQQPAVHLMPRLKCSALAVACAQAPLYTLKARLFPGSTFVVGYDTAIRLVMPKYYGGQEGMLLQFAELKHAGCRHALQL